MGSQRVPAPLTPPLGMAQIAALQCGDHSKSRIKKSRIHCVETSTQANLVNKSHKAFDMKDVLTIPQVENTLSLLDSHRLYVPCRNTSSHSQHPQRTSSYWAEADPLAALKHDFLNYICRRFLSSLVTWQPVNSVVWGAPKKPILLKN